MNRPFDLVLAAYRELSTNALYTLHIDIRYGIVCSMAPALEGPYTLEQPISEPDPDILRLNSDLLSFDDTITSHLPDKEYGFVSGGLGLLLDAILFSTKSSLFFDYFDRGPAAIVDKARETGGENLGLDLDEFKALIELCYSEQLLSPQRDIAAQAKRQMGDDMMQLTELMWAT